MAPLEGWWDCAGHWEQTALEPLASNVPGEHGAGSVAPTPHAWPGGQLWQSSAEDNPVSLPKRPDAHGRVAGDPVGQKPPSSQARGATVASAPHTDPAGQRPEHSAVDWALTPSLLPWSPAAHAWG